MYEHIRFSLHLPGRAQSSTRCSLPPPLSSEVGLLYNEGDVCLSGMSSEEIRARVHALITMSTCVTRRAC